MQCWSGLFWCKCECTCKQLQKAADVKGRANIIIIALDDLGFIILLGLNAGEEAGGFLGITRAIAWLSNPYNPAVYTSANVERTSSAVESCKGMRGT